MFLPYLILLVFQISIDDDEQSSESQVMDTAVQTTTETSEKRTCTDYSITGTVSKGLVHDTERLISQTYPLSNYNKNRIIGKLSITVDFHPILSISMAIYKFVSLSVVNYGEVYF